MHCLASLFLALCVLHIFVQSWVVLLCDFQCYTMQGSAAKVFVFVSVFVSAFVSVFISVFVSVLQCSGGCSKGIPRWLVVYPLPQEITITAV